MNARKRARLQARGYTVGGIGEVLDLDAAEVLEIEITQELGAAVRAKRERLGLSQRAAAKLMGTSQPKLCQVEQGIGTLERTFTALLALGASRTEVARVVRGATRAATAAPNRLARAARSAGGQARKVKRAR